MTFDVIEVLLAEGAIRLISIVVNSAHVLGKLRFFTELSKATSDVTLECSYFVMHRSRVTIETRLLAKRFPALAALVASQPKVNRSIVTRQTNKLFVTNRALFGSLRSCRLMLSHVRVVLASDLKEESARFAFVRIPLLFVNTLVLCEVSSRVVCSRAFVA